MRPLRLLPLALILGGCIGMQGQGPAVAELPAPTTSRTYANASEPEDPTCRTGPCDEYVLTFPAGTRVHVELRSTAPSTSLFVRRADGSTDLSATGTPEAPAVLELLDGGTAPVRILAGTSGVYSSGDYQLVVGPEPLAEVTLPQPKMTAEARRAKILADNAVLPELAVSEKEAKAYLRDEVGRLEATAFKATAAMERFAPVAIPVEAGYCYRVAFALQAGASYSELASRGIDGSVETPDQKQPSQRVSIVGRHGLTEQFCAHSAGDAHFVLGASRAPAAERAQLGTGSIDLTLYRWAFWPGVKSKDELAKAIREYTKGHAAASRFELDLATAAAASRTLKVQRGKCYALVFRLGKGASWSDAAREQNIGVDFQGEVEDLSAGPGLIGPGAVSAMGCAQQSQTYTMTIKAYGQNPSLGTGTLSAQLYVRNARKGELGQLEREDREQRSSDDADAARRKAEHCAKCREDNYGDKEGLETCAAQWYARDACY